MQLEEVQSVGKWISRWSECEKESQNTDQSKMWKRRVLEEPVSLQLLVLYLRMLFTMYYFLSLIINLDLCYTYTKHLVHLHLFSNKHNHMKS